MFVHTSEYEPKQPQLDPKPKGSDPQGLLNARPARAETAVPRLLPLNPFTLTNGSQIIKVNEPNHGRSTSDRVRFRDAQNIANITPAIINLAIGYVITKTDDNNYTFDSGNTASKTISGGGGSAFAGPVTVVK
jgi:hypothetical protein